MLYVCGVVWCGVVCVCACVWGGWGGGCVRACLGGGGGVLACVCVCCAHRELLIYCYTYMRLNFDVHHLQPRNGGNCSRPPHRWSFRIQSLLQYKDRLSRSRASHYIDEPVVKPCSLYNDIPGTSKSLLRIEHNFKRTYLVTSREKNIYA